MAYESWTSHFFASRAATIFFAIYRAIYAAERSTFVQSFPEKAPPPCLAYPPYVSTIILRPVRPVSPCGPPITKRPVGFIYSGIFVNHFRWQHWIKNILLNVAMYLFL